MTSDDPPASPPPSQARLQATVRLPISYFGLRDKVVPLPEPVPEIVVNAAADACRTHHEHHCRPCQLLSSLHTVLYVPIWRIALIIGCLVLPLPVLAMTNTLSILPRYLIFGGMSAVVGVHLLLAACMAAAVLHRRRMPMEMSIRVANAHRDLTRP